MRLDIFQIQHNDGLMVHRYWREPLHIHLHMLTYWQVRRDRGAAQPTSGVLNTLEECSKLYQTHACLQHPTLTARHSCIPGH